MGDESVPPWMESFDARERAQIVHAQSYASYHASAGVPGHGQFLLIAKLAQLLDDREPHEDSDSTA